MSVLSDGTLKNYLQEREIGIDPLDEGAIQPASVDLRLYDEFLIDNDGIASVYLDKRETFPELTQIGPPGSEEKGWGKLEYIYLPPQKFLLGATLEYVRVPNFLVARIEGKSSLGRIGLLVHATAGYIDPGFEGRITLEFFNLSRHSIALVPGVPICQLSFHELNQPAEKPYGHADLNSKYQQSETVVGSRYGL